MDDRNHGHFRQMSCAILFLVLFFVESSTGSAPFAEFDEKKPIGVLADKRMQLVVYPNGLVVTKGSWIDSDKRKEGSISQDSMVILDYAIRHGMETPETIVFEKPYLTFFLARGDRSNSHPRR